MGDLMRAKYFVSVFVIIAIAAVLLYARNRPFPKSECYICSGRFRDMISYDSDFGIINLNSRNVSMIPRGDWTSKNNTTINSSKDGSMIVISTDISGCYRADIHLKADIGSNQSIMPKYLCKDCVDLYGVSEYDVVLMEATTGAVYFISKSMREIFPFYEVSAGSEGENQIIRLYFKRRE